MGSPGAQGRVVSARRRIAREVLDVSQVDGECLRIALGEGGEKPGVDGDDDCGKDRERHERRTGESENGAAQKDLQHGEILFDAAHEDGAGEGRMDGGFRQVPATLDPFHQRTAPIMPRLLRILTANTAQGMAKISLARRWVPSPWL